jgi:outer membrane immunogenic protein
VLQSGDGFCPRAGILCRTEIDPKTLRDRSEKKETEIEAMKKFLLGVIGLAAGFAALGVAAPASAADLAARPYTKAPPPMMVALYDWSGFYVGLNGGGGWSRKCWDRNTALGGTFSAAEGCHDASGGVFGGQVGYRWQAGGWVFGVEAQGDWADIKGSNTSLIVALNANLAPLPATANRSKIDAFGLFTGQVGYAWNNVLWYVKGGAAVVEDKYSGFFPVTGLTFDRASETRWGGVVGTGLEFAFAPNWSVAFEYDHLFMGTRTLDFNSVTPPIVFSREDRIRQDVDLATVRINYRWGGPVIAKY